MPDFEEAQFDSKIFKQILSVGFEEDAEMEVSKESAEGDIVRDAVAFNELLRKVSVENIEKSSSPPDKEAEGEHQDWHNCGVLKEI